jgi:small subunit ribosomal protein S8
MLTRIRNATLAKKSNVNIPFTKLNQEIAQILEKKVLSKLSNFNGN